MFKVACGMISIFKGSSGDDRHTHTHKTKVHGRNEDILQEGHACVNVK